MCFPRLHGPTNAFVPFVLCDADISSVFLLHRAIALDTMQRVTVQAMAYNLFAFERMLKTYGPALPPGSEIMLVYVPPWTPLYQEGVVHVAINGRSAGYLRGSAFNQALLGMLFGDNSVAPDLQPAVVAYIMGSVA